MTGILVVEDEPRIASFIAKGLKSAGFVPITVGDGASALQIALTADIQLMILDIGLPDMDGYEVLDRLRAQGSTVPVIVLTARTSVDDTIASLEGGADDYMPKPFRFEELLARVRLRLRTPAASDAGAGTATHELTAGALSLNLHARELTVDGATHDLSAREFSLLETFVRHPRQVLSREQLLSRVWGYDFDPDSNVVDVYVGYLRKKLGSERIVTVRGMGYRLEP